MEGKESCFGIVVSMFWVIIIIVVLNGLVNVMYDSLSFLGGMLLLLNMMFGEVIFGGVGVGFYGMLLFVLIVVFFVGLMVGWMLEYLGKKFEVKEVCLLVFILLVMFVGVLVFGVIVVSLLGLVLVVINFGLYGFS